MRPFKYIFLLLLLCSHPLWAQETTKTVSEMTREQIQQLTYEELLAMPFEDLVAVSQRLGISIDELLKMKTTVASSVALTPRETPGIVSIITNEEIKNMGARDLIDVLRTVPGISFGYDSYGVIGIQMRGNWAHEGKVLMVIDGQEFNDLKYNTLQFGQHFDVTQIKRIEIIRGPGSALYGGNAELGVINIITFTGEELKKISVAASYGAMENNMGHENVSLAAGNKIKDWDLSLKAFASKGNRTDEQNYVLYDETYDLSKSGAETDAVNLNFGAKYKNLSLRAIFDDYNSAYVWYDDESQSQSIGNQEFTTIAGEAKYDWNISKKLIVSPKINIRNNIPYYDLGWYLNNSFIRTTGNVTARYNASETFSLSGGVEYFNDQAKMMESTDSSYFNNGKRTIAYNTFSVFAEGLIKTGFANLVIGGRYDHHNVFGAAFAPRIALTKAWEKYHLKLLYSGAFRSPSIGNMMFNPDIKPERTTVLELEAGLKLNSNMFITANIYNIKINDPIIWFENNVETGYVNQEQTGTWGYELEYRLKYNWGYATVNYSFSHANDNKVAYYEVPDEERMIGDMTHKVTLNSGLHINKHICLNPSIMYLGDTYFDPTFAADYGISPKVGSEVLANCFVNFSNYKIAGKVPIEFGVGVFDIFNQKYPFVQPYSGYQNPYPGSSREFTFRLACSLGK